MKVAGVDGCKGGWVVAVRDMDSDELEIRVLSAFKDVLSVVPPPGTCVSP